MTNTPTPERRLLKEDELFSKAFQFSPEGMAITRFSDGVVFEANSSFAKLFGLTPPQVIGRTTIDLKVHANPVDRMRSLDKLRRDRGLRDYEIIIPLPSGELLTTLWTVELLEIRGEEYLLTLVRDVTDKRKTEQALKASEAKFRELADAMPQIVWAAGPYGHIDFYNVRWYEYTGSPGSSESDKSLERILHPEDVEAHQQQWADAVVSGSPYKNEYRFRDRTSGHFRWFLVSAIPIKSDGGNVIRWFGTCTDIHDQKMAELQIKQHASELERSNRDLEQFAYVASHDLQEPLRKISSYVELLSMYAGDSLPEKARGCLNPIVAGVQRMHDLIKGLLDYSRVNAGEFESQSVDLAAELKLAAETVFHEKDVLFTSDPLPIVEGNQMQYRQLFENLLSNAIKFHNPGHPKHVRVSKTQKVGGWVIGVHDNGIGIPPEYKDKIFTIFKRLHGPNKFPGTGIGLAICKKIVEFHKGKIWVESVPGGETSFYFSIPR